MLRRSSRDDFFLIVDFISPVCGQDGQTCVCLSCCRIIFSRRLLQLLSLRPCCRHGAKFSAATVTSDQLARSHCASVGSSNTQVALACGQQHIPKPALPFLTGAASAAGWRRCRLAAAAGTEEEERMMMQHHDDVASRCCGS